MKKLLIICLLLTLVSCTKNPSPEDYPIWDSKETQEDYRYNFKDIDGNFLCEKWVETIYSGNEYNEDGDFSTLKDGYAIVEFEGEKKMQVIDKNCDRIGQSYDWIDGFFTKDIDIVGIRNDEEIYLDNGKKRNSYNLMNKKGELLFDEWIMDISAGELQDGYVYIYNLNNYDNGYWLNNLVNKKGELFFDEWPHSIYRIDIGSDEEWVKELRTKYYGDERGGEHYSDIYSKWVFDGYIYYMIDQNPTSKNDCGTTDFRGIDCKWYKVKEDNKSQIEYLGDNVHPEDILKKDEKLLKILRETKTERYIEKYLK